MKFKKIGIYLLAFVLLAASLFMTACSEDEVEALVNVASQVLTETTAAGGSGQTVADATAAETPADVPEGTGQNVEEESFADLQGESPADFQEESYEADPQEETPSVNDSGLTDPSQDPDAPTEEPDTETAPDLSMQIREDGEYLSMEEVATYLHLYGHLPGNYLTKQEAKDLGWIPNEENLWDVAQGAAIGGDRFGNREKLLPNKKGRKYYECDVNYDGNDRDAERLVYSNDGLIYYTDNHYEDFMLLFDGEE